MATHLRLIKNFKKELFQNYIHSDQPTAIPYITSYYKSIGVFCVTETDKKKIKNRLKNIKDNEKNYLPKSTPLLIKMES